MTAWSQAQRGGLLSALVARAERWLLEPASSEPRVEAPLPGARPVVAVIGLGPRCGATTVARALAVELARRDGAGVAFVSAAAPPRAAMLATGPARRLARRTGEHARAAGRLCLVPDSPVELRELTQRRAAPLVIDVAAGTAPEAAVALADVVVLVAADGVEPALASVVAASLERGRRRPAVVLNRVVDEDASWPDAVLVAEGRLGARLALAGREPVGGLAEAAAALADRCEQEQL